MPRNAQRKPARTKRRPRTLGAEIDLGRVGGVVVAVYGDDTGPLERYKHDPIRTTDTLVDGRLATVQRTIDPIGRMLSTGTISPEEARAARRFRTDFDLAQFHGIKAMDMDGVRVQANGGGVSETVTAARERVWRALEHVGRHARPLVWAVLGEGHSIGDWSEQPGAQKNKHTNRGILIASLGVLAVLYDFG